MLDSLRNSQQILLQVLAVRPETFGHQPKVGPELTADFRRQLADLHHIDAVVGDRLHQILPVGHIGQIQGIQKLPGLCPGTGAKVDDQGEHRAAPGVLGSKLFLIAGKVITHDPEYHIFVLLGLVFDGNNGEHHPAALIGHSHIPAVFMPDRVCIPKKSVVGAFLHIFRQQHGLSVKDQHIEDVRKDIRILLQPFGGDVFLMRSLRFFSFQVSSFLFLRCVGMQKQRKTKQTITKKLSKRWI